MIKTVRYPIIFLFFSLCSLHAFTLKDGFKLALENDMDFRVNQNNLKNIKFDQKIADSLFLPSVDFSATVEADSLTQGKMTPGEEPFTKTDNYQLKVTQPVFDGFESKFEQKLQEQIFKSAVYYLKESQDSVAIDYSTAYINTLKEKDLLSLSKESLQISRDIFNKVYKKVESGYGTKLEYDEANGNLAENRVNLNIQKINFREAIENLRLYVQADFDSSELEKPNFSIELPKNLEEALKIALDDNPSINVAKANVDVAKFEQKKALKNFYPNIDFVTSYNANNVLYKEENEDYNEYKLGFEINYNLYNGGRDTLENKKALQNIEDKSLIVKKNEFQTKSALRLSWNNYKLFKEKQKNLEQYVIVKKDILDANMKEFDLGLQKLNDLLDINVEYIDVKKDLIRNSYDLLLAKYKIMDSMGKLSEVLEDKIPTLEKVDTTEFVKNMDRNLDFIYNDDKKLDEKKLKTVRANKIVKKVNFENTIIKPTNFKDRFLSANGEKYTINLAYTKSEYRAKKIIEDNDLLDTAFYFSFGFEKPLQKVMHGIFDTKAEALNYLNSLPKNLLNFQPRVEKVSIKQKLYEKYHGVYIKENPSKNIAKRLNNNVTTVAFNSPIPNKPKKEETNYSFKDIFLNASKNKYTINLAYSKSEKRAKWIIESHNLSNDAFYFSFGYEEPLQKIMYGVFDSKEEATNALNSLPKSLKSNKPRVEKVSIKQDLFHKYHKNYSSNLGSI